MNIATIKPFDIANGPGVRVSVFVSGCTRHCDGCFNAEAWDFDYGTHYVDVKNQILELLSNPRIKGLTVLGGEPFEPPNQPGVSDLVQSVSVGLPDKDIWCFTGYTIEELTSPELITNHITDILTLVDVLVDGPFIREQKDLMLKYRGSGNQRIIDMNRTREQNKIELWNDRYS